MSNKKNLGAIILAAGKGKRMKAKKINKVTLPIGNKPMILQTLDLLESLSISPIIVVVGFAKKSVMDLLDQKVIFAEQKRRLGTGHAVLCALPKLPKDISAVLVVNGDDSAFYKEEIIEQLIKVYFDSPCDIALLTTKVDKPFGLGRVIRDQRGKIIKVTEEKDAVLKEKKINEIITGCYIFNVEFLRKYLRKIEKSSLTDEYYLVSLIELAVEEKRKVITVLNENLLWRGVNTEEELKEAENLFLKTELKI